MRWTEGVGGESAALPKGYEVKTYVIQAADGRLIGVKLTREAAQAIAKLHAPARVTMVLADKVVIGKTP
jgi:hypothetical protein